MTIADKPESIAPPQPAAHAADPSPRRFTRDEYYGMADTGMFQGQHVELINGEILYMSPQGSPHAWTIMTISRWLSRRLPDNLYLRCQMPLIGNATTEPVPDLAIIAEAAATPDDDPHTALLVIEVSHTTLEHDRRKAGLYASVGVNEYWIVNLSARQIEVYRQPQPDAATEFGHRYASMQTYAADQPVQPASVPLDAITVTDLLPAAS